MHIIGPRCTVSLRAVVGNVLKFSERTMNKIKRLHENEPRDFTKENKGNQKRKRDEVCGPASLQPTSIQQAHHGHASMRV